MSPTQIPLQLRAPGKRRLILALGLTVWVAITLLAYVGFVAPTRGVAIDIRRAVPDTGHCYIVPVHGGESDSDGHSLLRFYENSRELGPGHTQHAEIRAQGGGLYSHWGDLIYFSSSDNTDPRRNGRHYEARVLVVPSSGCLWFSVAAWLLVAWPWLGWSAGIEPGPAGGPEESPNKGTEGTGASSDSANHHAPSPGLPPSGPCSMQRTTSGRQFDFGQNWLDFAQKALDPARLTVAGADFARLLQGVPLTGRTFLDVGFGQGLSLLLAAKAGARVVGCDINPKCAQALLGSGRFMPEVKAQEIPVIVGSILDDAVLQRVRALAPEGDRGYDIVHSWGVLHHTGDMRRALAHTASLVRPGGHLVVAIYNRHWSSPLWHGVKWLYAHSPSWARHLLIRALSPVIFLAKWLVTRRDPRQQQRGMEFHHNVVDWVGGYPYEYASIGEFRSWVEPLGFTLIRAVPAEVPTGCNEFVFKRAMH